MSGEQRIWALLPAAGIGRRMAAEVPKQYLPVAGKCVIEHTVEALCRCGRISGVVAAVAEADPHWRELELERRYPVERVAGGAERAESVLNGLEYLLSKTSGDDWVLVHDAVRPCLDPRDLESLLRVALETGDGAILAIPVRDTMKRVRGSRIRETVPREDLWQAQTPQMFPLALLHQALQRAAGAGLVVTDESQAMERQGFAPRVVEGRTDNIKITRPEDLQQAARYLERAAH